MRSAAFVFQFLLHGGISLCRGSAALHGHFPFREGVLYSPGAGGFAAAAAVRLLDVLPDFALHGVITARICKQPRWAIPSPRLVIPLKEAFRFLLPYWEERILKKL